MFGSKTWVGDCGSTISWSALSTTWVSPVESMSSDGGVFAEEGWFLKLQVKVHDHVVQVDHQELETRMLEVE